MPPTLLCSPPCCGPLTAQPECGQTKRTQQEVQGALQNVLNKFGTNAASDAEPYWASTLLASAPHLPQQGAGRGGGGGHGGAAAGGRGERRDGRGFLDGAAGEATFDGPHAAVEVRQRLLVLTQRLLCAFSTAAYADFRRPSRRGGALCAAGARRRYRLHRAAQPLPGRETLRRL